MRSHTERQRVHKLLQTGQAPQAVKLAARLARQHPADPTAWLTLGTAQRLAGSPADAEQSLQRAASLAPRDARCHHALGVTLHLLGRREEAIHSYRTAAGLAPTMAETHYLLGNALRETGRLPEAADAYQAAIRVRPDYLEALCNLGGTLVQLGRITEALDHLSHADRLRPRTPQVLCNLAEALLLADRPGQALEKAETAAALAPGLPDGHRVLGNVQRQLGDYDAALRHFARVLELAPGDPVAASATALILEGRHEYEAARRILAPLLAGPRPHPAVVTAFSRLAAALERREQAVTLLDACLQGPDPGLQHRVDLEFELGRHLDALERYDEAFAHYRRANEASEAFTGSVAEAVGRDAATAELEGLVEDFDPGLWQRVPRSGCTSRQPVFVVGMPRSGTTLMEQILASHPDCDGAGELTDMGRIAAEIAAVEGGRTYPACLADMTPTALARHADSYLRSLRRHARDVARIVDKMPHNFMRIGLISALFPEARVIHMRRDPLDTCLSIYFQKFGATLPYTTRLSELGRFYRAYDRLMALWRTTATVPILEVDYERLVEAPEETIRAVVAFCGLEWHPACLEFHTQRRDVNTPSYQQVRQPIYRGSVARWRKYERHLGPLRAALEGT